MGGRDGVRGVFGVSRRTLRDVRGSAVIEELYASGDEAWPEARVGAFGNTVVKREHLILFGLGREVGLQLFEFVGIPRGGIIGFAVILRKVTELPGVLIECLCKSHDRRRHPSFPSPPGPALAGNSSNRLPGYHAVS
jgi:hypothetical protein